MSLMMFFLHSDIMIHLRRKYSGKNAVIRNSQKGFVEATKPEMVSGFETNLQPSKTVSWISAKSSCESLHDRDDRYCAITDPKFLLLGSVSFKWIDFEKKS
jgi:hypothetical protein